MIYMSNSRKTIVNSRTGDSYVHVSHKSGLNVLIWKMDGYTTTEALFGTRYGSVNTRFKTKDDQDYCEVPEGIAHFLEHKLFENEDCPVFDLYAKTGASANAYTSFDQTVYLFSCSENYEQSLRILLSFVQKPFFTQETIDKEQGIIGQEISMGEDSPERRSFFNLLKCLYVNNPVKIDIAGTVESIAEITPELLYKCYNSFYNLHNMTLAIAGNLDVDEVLKICDEELKPCDDVELENFFPDEPDEVAQRECIETASVGASIFNIGFKAKAFKGKELLKKEIEASIVLQLIAGPTSQLYKELTDEGIINSTFSSEVFNGNGFFCCIIGGESHEPRKVYDRLLKEIEKIKQSGFDKEQFTIIKKSKYGSLIRDFNNVSSCAELMINSDFEGLGAFDSVETLAAVTIEDITKTLMELFVVDKSAISVIEPINDERE